MDVQRRPLAVRWNAAFDLEDDLARVANATQAEPFTRVTILEPGGQSPSALRSSPAVRRPRVTLDIMSSHARQRTRQLDTMSSCANSGDPATRRRILDATLRLVTKRGGADVTLAEIARAARVSRQALYLHFADRAALFLALVRHVDEQRGLTAAIQRVMKAPTGIAALQEAVAMQAGVNPQLWPLARAFESVRRQDEAAERSWQDRLENRLRGCRTLVARLAREGSLRRELDPAVAADLLWTLTSLRAWEDLVLQRGWSAEQYEKHLGAALLTLLTGSGENIP
jgi:AcrR family transcriptional regulator